MMERRIYTGLKFYVGEAQTRVSQASQLNSQASQAIASLQQSIQSFLSAPLSGKAYDSAKNYFSVAYMPLCRAAIMTGEELEQAHKKFLSDYQGSVSGIDTDEDQILDEIQRFEELKRHIDYLISTAKTPRPDLERRYMNACDCITKRQEKVEKFYAYNARSASFFAEYQACQQEFDAGVAQVMNSKTWNSASGTFELSRLNMTWAKPINTRWQQREEARNKKVEVDKNTWNKAKGFMEGTVFPTTQDVALELAEDWFTNNGDKVATGLYNSGTKYFGGTEVASGFYAGSKIVGSAGKALPVVGVVFDYGSQVAGGETVNDAAYKTIGHAVNGVIVGAGITILGISGGWAIVGVIGAGYLANNLLDKVYDNREKIVKGVGDAIKSMGNWLGCAF